MRFNDNGPPRDNGAIEYQQVLEQAHFDRFAALAKAFGKKM